MTVKELIDKLQQFNGDRVVLVEDAEYGEFQAIDVKPENFDLTVGANYARIKAEDKIWEGLGFVLQWAKYGLKK
nr:MAG: hypothetical protein [Bacteriophage sp.]